MKKLKLIINNEKKGKFKNAFFIKKEMQTILNLYAKMVSNGEWKDYGLTLGPREISFDNCFKYVLSVNIFCLIFEKFGSPIKLFLAEYAVLAISASK